MACGASQLFKTSVFLVSEKGCMIYTYSYTKNDDMSWP